MQEESGSLTRCPVQGRKGSGDFPEAEEREEKKIVERAPSPVRLPLPDRSKKTKQAAGKEMAQRGSEGVDVNPKDLEGGPGKTPCKPSENSRPTGSRP